LLHNFKSSFLLIFVTVVDKPKDDE
jgi:hypothetical protein